MYLSVGVVAENIKHISYICAIHADEQIVPAVIAFLELNSPFAVTGKSMLCKLRSCRRIDGISDAVPNLLGARCRGSDFKSVLYPLLLHKILHYKLRHRAAADIAVTDEHYFDFG